MKPMTISTDVDLLFRISHEPMVVIDPRGAILAQNSAASHVIPASPGMPLQNVLEETVRLEEAIQKALEDESGEIRLDVSIKRGSAPAQKAGARMVPIGNPNEGPPRLVCVFSFQDIHLDVLQEAARLNDARADSLSHQLLEVGKELVEKTGQLAKEKNKMLAILNGMGDGLIGCDSDGMVIQSNQTARDLLGLEMDCTGQALADLCPTVAMAIHLDPETPILHHSQEVNVSQKRRELRVNATAIHDSDKRYAGCVLIVQDRTQQAEVDRMKSELISIVSHELRSPLTSIKGYVDLMLTGGLGDAPDSIKNHLGIVSDNANRLAKLIDDMLDLSRIESGKLTMNFGKVDVKYLCDYVYHTLKPLADQKEQAFELSIEKGLFVSGDIERLQQAVTNLAANAIKYTPEKKRIEINAYRDHQSVKIDVADQGIGISEEDQTRLFQKFFRVKNKHTRNIGGTGLGLCITQSIVEAHEGAIHLQSIEEKGSTFSIELPAFKA